MSILFHETIVDHTIFHFLRFVKQNLNETIDIYAERCKSSFQPISQRMIDMTEPSRDLWLKNTHVVDLCQNLWRKVP